MAEAEISPARGGASRSAPARFRSPDFPRQFGRTRRFSLGAVRDVTLSPDGLRALFLRTDPEDPLAALWEWEDGRERLLAHPRSLAAGPTEPTEEELTRRERARDVASGVTSYAVDGAAELAVFSLDGAVWAVRTRRGEPFPVPAAGPATDPRPSPDGRLVAYVTGGALHVVATDGGGERRLAAPESDDVKYGLTDHVSAESMGRMRGYWWAPDGSALLAARVDESAVGRRYLADPAEPHKPPRVQRYPVAGSANAEVTCWLLGLDGSRVPVDWDREGFEYLASGGWDAHGPLITVQSRDQRTVRTLAVDPASGGTRVLAEQRDDHWVELVPGAYRRTASGALVVPCESEGTRRLRVGGEVVTPAGLQLRVVLGTDGDSVLFTASEDPLETHVWAYSPASGCTRLSSTPGVHTGLSRGGTTVLDSLTDDGHQVGVLRAEGPPAVITSRAEEPSLLPRPVRLTLGERRLRSALFLPSWYDPQAAGAAPLPVLADPYSGPGLQLVVRGRTWNACVSQWFAEQGYAVLVTDGRGTPGRGPAWEKAVWGDQLTPVLEDQTDALHAAAERYPFLDLDRVGIRGWSFSGWLAAAAVLRRPETFHAAVAGAPAVDPRLYDTHWKERFLGHPAEYPEHYDRCTLTREAELLRRPLLLVHGTTDDNVAFAHTLRMSAALQAAGREHAVLPLSGQSHIVSDEVTSMRLLTTQLVFLDKALRP
ncbi:dipeptidyl-peptidase-4 [Streptomyces sp. WMMB 714]|uniref:prolyl oligopeptidase family serine peptidase n=1 Tax=Streptomyces sp. WMMB 714 TaxID=1286822 RepID=UPI0008237FF1|nr:prolyl oligopeptidase family serine peptidase [Streptomyces sp. WMMB 714]SCK52285.1 dipeptidyl-peptidase-4 [Streptomyces sp. WMMB 714]